MCAYAQSFVYTQMRAIACTQYMHLHPYEYIHVHMCTYVRVRVHVCAHVYIYVHMHAAYICAGMCKMCALSVAQAYGVQVLQET